MTHSPGKRGNADGDLAAALAMVEQIRPALARRDRAGLNDIVRRLIEMRAPMGGQWEQLAYLAASHGELGLARAALDRLAEAAGNSPAAQFHQATVLAELGALHEADALLRALPEDVPAPEANTYSRGMVALNLGRRDEARRRLEKVTHMRPQTGAAWLMISLSADLAREPELAERLIAARAVMDRAAPAEQAPYYYALGKAHVDRGEHTLAFEACSRGATLMKPQAPYDHAADRADAARAIDGYSAERIAAIAGEQREPTGRTIFVTGLPRSGTTLVEQILTCHSAVAGGAEIDRLSLLAKDIGGQSWSALARYVEAQGVAGVPPLWDHWLDELFSGPGRIIDKTVDASRYLGLAAALLPEAPLVWMTRDPLERAWSCFRTNFRGSAMPWSYDLRDIAAHFRLEDRLLAQWREILGERLLVVSYETLVADPEAEIRRILAHCALVEEPAVFAPHENARAVTTASMMQVRRPINRDALGSAEPYRAFLEPFVEGYHD